MENDDDNDEKCRIELDFKDMKKGTIYGNNEKTIEQLNKENVFKNNNNQINYDKLKYKEIKDENITTDNSGGNKQIPINDENLIKDIKDKEFNDDVNYEDFEKRKTCENFEDIRQLIEETLFTNIGCYYDDIDEEKIDRNDTEEILNEKYLLKNDDYNDEKCYSELIFKDTKKEIIYGNNEKGNEQLYEENLFNFINKKSIDIILNKIKNKVNENALYKLIEGKNILETFVSQVLRYVMDLIPILLKDKNEWYAVQTRSHFKDSKNINNTKNENNIKNKLIRNVALTNKVQKSVEGHEKLFKK